MPQTIATTLEYAQQKDREDELQGFRSRFYFPTAQGREMLYFCGNSLGLQPRQAAEFLQQELADWRELAIGGYWQARNPWMTYPQSLRPALSRIVGCLEDEVTVMNALTVNLHLFFRLGLWLASGSDDSVRVAGSSGITWLRV